jgi:hypothetical protein
MVKLDIWNINFDIIQHKTKVSEYDRGCGPRYEECGAFMNFDQKTCKRDGRDGETWLWC